MYKSLLFVILLLTLSQPLYADCQGCCSSRGGVKCIGGVTKCADGTALSDTCKAKGCDVCSSSSSSGGCFING